MQPKTSIQQRPILPLSQLVANQIAAGEVIERPASVLKEFLENSIDAGARHLRIEACQGGIELIRVTDDGWGIPHDQLALALQRHATSKIDTSEDLARIASLGFRGEALASIGAVSRLRMTSHHGDAESAWGIESSPMATTTAIEPAAHPVGTTVEMRDLFYNTPARRKFLRSDQTEYRHLDEVIKRMALSHFEIAIDFHHNERDVYRLRAANDESSRVQRIQRLCGKHFMEHAAQIDVTNADMRLWGWATLPVGARPQTDLQFFYVNGRIVRDRVISHALRQAYEDSIHPGRHPAYVLHLELDPAVVDVNVHPTKHEVRFRAARQVHDFLAQALRQVLRGGSQRADNSISAQTANVHTHQPGIAAIRERTGRYDNNASQPPAAGVFGRPLGIMGDYFAVAEREGRMCIYDMRVLQGWWLRRQMDVQDSGGGLVVQPLLLPANIKLDAEQFRLFDSHQSILRRLGFDLEASGPQSVRLRAMPAIARGAAMDDLIPAMLKSASSGFDAVVTHLCKLLATVNLPRSERELQAWLGQIELSGVVPDRMSYTIELDRLQAYFDNLSDTTV